MDYATHCDVMQPVLLTVTLEPPARGYSFAYTVFCVAGGAATAAGCSRLCRCSNTATIHHQTVTDTLSGSAVLQTLFCGSDTPAAKLQVMLLLLLAASKYKLRGQHSRSNTVRYGRADGIRDCSGVRERSTLWLPAT